jgi:hypothetical protein
MSELNAGLAAWQAERRADYAQREADKAASQRLWDANWRAREKADKERKQANQRRRTSKRRADERLRSPAWADQTAIAAVYLEAKRLEVETGVPHHVDHIYPLCGRLVSGLHVAGNLQVLTALANMKKHNKFEVDV